MCGGGRRATRPGQHPAAQAVGEHGRTARLGPPEKRAALAVDALEFRGPQRQTSPATSTFGSALGAEIGLHANRCAVSAGRQVEPVWTAASDGPWPARRRRTVKSVAGVLIPLGQHSATAATGENRRTGGAGEIPGTTGIVAVDFALRTTIIDDLGPLLHPIPVGARCVLRRGCLHGSAV